MNTLHPTYDPGASPEALALFRCILHKGGSIRMDTLQRRTNCDRDPAILWSFIDELAERYWITVAWHKGALDKPPDAPRLLDDVDRLCATRFGKRKARQSLWGMQRPAGARR